MNRNLADALHAAAHELAPDVHLAQYLTDEDRERGARGIQPSLVPGGTGRFALFDNGSVIEVSREKATP